jgi:hypothetical protein
MQLTDFEALSFDCYGTLIDWEAGLGVVLGRWAAARGLHLDIEQLLTLYGEHEVAAEGAHPTVLYPDILARSFRALGHELGAEVSERDASALAPRYPTGPPSRTPTTPWPGSAGATVSSSCPTSIVPPLPARKPASALPSPVS